MATVLAALPLLLFLCVCSARYWRWAGRPLVFLFKGKTFEGRLRYVGPFPGEHTLGFVSSKDRHAWLLVEWRDHGVKWAVIGAPGEAAFRTVAALTNSNVDG